jgi:hypothetical protein
MPSDTWLEVLVVLAALGWVVILLLTMRSLRKRRLVRRLLSEAQACAQQGDARGAVTRLEGAERAWVMDPGSGGRKSCVRDLGLLSAIIREMATLLDADGARPLFRELEETLRELTDLFQDRANFRLDGRMMKGDAPARWVALSERLSSLRSELRAVAAAALNGEGFESAAEHVVGKNAALYRRLA